MEQGHIIIKGARQHNLKGIDLELPRGKLVVITGPSGSGKSSLALDTIYAEGQRRYVESLSAYARQFLDQMEKPEVDFIDGLSPAISIDRKNSPKNPRSTVGTITEIYDYLRLLYARIGIPHCYHCGREIASQTVQQIVDQIMELATGTRIHVLAPIIRGKRGEFRKELREVQRQGFIRVRVDGEIRELTNDAMILEKDKKHQLEVVVDRLVIQESIKGRLTDSIELALKLAEGLVLVQRDNGPELLFSERFACLECGTNLPEITPRLFSFNSPYGACPTCGGLGINYPGPINKDDEENIAGQINKSPCPSCKGNRLRPEALSIKISGKSIAEVTLLNIKQAQDFFRGLELSPQQYFIARTILKEINDRLNFLVEVGLDYLTLDRGAATLSGGESQRIRLATQIGSRLVGVLYILDEPTIGLHPRDNQRLLKILKDLQGLGNTVIVIEHDRDTIMAGDHVIDLGPGAGVHGGYLVASGTPGEILNNCDSPTGNYLSGRLSLPLPTKRRSPNQGWLIIHKANKHNLKDIEVSIPLGLFTCITGVSGSGKSTLLIEVLYNGLKQKGNTNSSGLISGSDAIDKVININQAPIGRTPRSNPATYTGLFTLIRELFAQLPESRNRGYGAGRFSFNVKGGRCEACQGDGLIKIEMYFLPDIYVPCEVCRGKRFNRETLEIRYKGKSIADILDMTVDQAAVFFRNLPRIAEKLDTLKSVGLDYIKLGQSANTLSGGEAQRIKLSKELARKSTGHTLYLLDEPTTGLHFVDIDKLLAVLNRLVDAGNTVIVIEHNLDVIKNADWIIDLGPEGGNAGGEVIASGTPEEVAQVSHSYTGNFLRNILFDYKAMNLQPSVRAV
jgi:excinuclease ABC subunit A